MRQMVKGAYFSEGVDLLERLKKKEKKEEFSLRRGVVVGGPFSDF